MAEELVGHAQNHEDGVQLMHQALAAASMQSVAEAEVEVDVPEGLKTADIFNVLFEGEEYELEVPKGMKPGQTMRVKLKDLKAYKEDESLLRIKLDVPADFQAGDAILVERDGKEFKVMLREDVKPGEQVSVTLREVKTRTTERFNNSEGPLQPMQEESMQQTFATSLFSTAGTEMQANGYLEKHQVLVWMQEILEGLVKEEPDSPWSYIARKVKQKRFMVGEVTEEKNAAKQQCHEMQARLKEMRGDEEERQRLLLQRRQRRLKEPPAHAELAAQVTEENSPGG